MKNKKIENIICSVVITVSILCFLAIMLFVLLKKNLIIDQNAIKFTLNIRNKGLTNFVKLFTHLGSIYFILILCLVVFLVFKNKQVGIFTGLSVLIGSIISVVIKYIFRRERPFHIALINEVGFSFPSAHSLISFCLFGMLAYFVLQYVKPVWCKIILSSFLILTSILVALTRVYLGVHYFSDVVAGMFLGIAIVAITIIIKNAINKLKNISCKS